MKSPWKKKKPEWNMIPQHYDLAEVFNDSYKSKAKDRMKLPVIIFIKRHNKNSEQEWLYPLLYNEDSLSLISYLCYGKETITILLKAIGGNYMDKNNTMPGFLLFEERLIDAPIDIENIIEFKSLLLEAIKKSCYIDKNEKNPVAILLSKTNEKSDKIGWLFKLGQKKTKSRTYRDKFLATALYSILGGGCNLDYCDILAIALGSSAKKAKDRKAWIYTIARETANEIIYNEMNGDAISIATTAPTAASTVTTAATNSITDTSFSTSSVLQSKRPPSLLTQDLVHDMVISPLTNRSRGGNFFPTYTKANDSCVLALNETNVSFSFLKSPSKAGMRIETTLRTPQTETQYKTPSKNSLNASSNASLKSPVVDMSFDNMEDSPCGGEFNPLSLAFGPDDDVDTSPTVLFEQKQTRPPPTPATIQRDKRRRRSSMISPDRFSIRKLLSPQKQTQVRKDPALTETSKEKLIRYCIANSANNNNDDDLRAAAMYYLFSEGNTFDKIDSIMTSTSKIKKKKLVSDAINFLSKNTNVDGSISNVDKTFIQVPKVKARRKDSKPASYKRYIKRKSADIKKVVGVLFGNSEDVEKDVLAHVLSNDYNQVVFEKEESDVKISALDVTEVRNRAGSNVASSVVVSIMKDTTSLLIKNNKLRIEKSPFEGQLRKKMGQLEKAGAVPSTFEYVECYITQENTGTCIYYYIEDVPLLIERLVAGCLLEGKYEDSIDISFFNNKIIIRFGCDRGGGDLIMGISLANRSRGNSGRYSIPIGVAEGATEVRSNLLKTVYSKARRAILEQLVNQHLFMVRLYFYEEDGVTLRDVKCVLLRFSCIGINREKLSGTKFVCTIDGNVLNHGTSVEWKSKAHGRSVADEVLINTNMFFGLQDDEQQQNVFFNNNNNNNNNGGSQFGLTVQLVKVEDMYVGCKITSTKTTEEIFSFEFDNGVDINEIDSSNISGDCLHLIGIPSEDGKMCACVYGVSTCGASHPCPKCDWHLKDKSTPLWMEDFGSTSNTFTDCKDFTPRTGTTSRDACHKNFIKLRGERTDPATVESKKSVLSIINEPLLHIDDDLLYLHNGEPMHVSQGLMTHLTKETATQMELIEMNGEDDFIFNLTVQVEEHITLMDDLKDSVGYKKARTAYSKADRLVKTKHNQYKQAVDDDEEEEDVIDEYFKEFEDAASKRDELGEQNEYVSMMKMIQGGLELKSLMIIFNKSKKKNFNKAAYIFMKAVKTFAGDFNKGHGVHELTNMLGIRALEQRQKIYDTVVDGCNSPAVTVVMHWWLECANLLYVISIMLKTQDKLVEDDVCKLKDLVVDYVYAWRAQLETYVSENQNPIFWKMHMLCCGLIEFVEITGMAGRCSAEGFENKHYVMNKIKRLMAPIALDKLRCEKLSQRQQSCLIPGIADVQNFFDRADKKVSTGIRGPYKSRGTRTKLLENLPLRATVEEDAEDGYFVSSQGNLIPDNLADMYAFMIYGKVPEEWAQAFHDSSSLGTKAANAAPYIPI
jgi:hypothetical protein